MTTMSGIHDSDHCTADHGQPCGECARRREREEITRQWHTDETDPFPIESPPLRSLEQAAADDDKLRYVPSDVDWPPAPNIIETKQQPRPESDFDLQTAAWAAAQDNTVSNRPLVASRRQLFEPPLSDDCDFRSLPLLLRAVADWMKANDVEDPEFDGLTIQQVSPTVNEDECRYTAILYYHRESNGPTDNGDAAQLLEMDAEEARWLLEEKLG